MQTVIEIDESILRKLESRARQEGKPVAAFIEETLRQSVAVNSNGSSQSESATEDQGLSDEDPFFAALEEIRQLGRRPIRLG